jgi:ParB-like chromosome segregation protein Spo0J
MPESQSFTVKWWTLDRVRPYEQNPRVISDVAIDKVAASIKAFGWRQPIVVDDDGVILAGHTRFEAAKKLGLERVPVHVASGLSPEAARAYRLADNRTHEEARWIRKGSGSSFRGLVRPVSISP